MRNLKKIKPPTQETDIPPYPFAKLGLDLSGPYPRSLSGNRYIVGFIDLFSGMPDAFAVPDRKAENIAHLVIEEIFPRYGAPLQIITDNGTENENRIVKETLMTLNVSHVTTSYYHPQSNAKVERFHRTLHNVMAKKLEDNLTTWDIHLNQTLAVIGFHNNKTTSCSPFFLLYNRDVVLPIYNILRPRRKYAGGDLHQIALENQHKAFTIAQRIMKQSKRRQARYADMKHGKTEELKVGDPVFYINNQRQSKLQNKWQPFYRIIKQTVPVTFEIKNQLTGRVIKAHQELLRFAPIDEWKIPQDAEGRPIRKAAYVVPPEPETETENSDNEDSEIDLDPQPINESLSNSDEEPSEKVPLSKLAKRYRKERDDWSSKDDIPLMEFSKLIKQRDAFKPETDEQVSEDEPSMNGDEHFDSDNTMSIDAFNLETPKIKRSRPALKHKSDVLKAMSQLFAALA